MPTAAQKTGAYARLLRLSNGPTAVADVWMGYAVVAGSLQPCWPLALMTFASVLMYHAGMIGNDLADLFEDRAEQRDRPIAAGQIPGLEAMRLRRGMEAASILCAAAAAWLAEASLLPILSLIALWACVRWYNSPLKRTLAGPPLMGACRGLNVVLGGCVAGFQAELLAVPLGVACYIDGVTLYARDERLAGGRSFLIAGTLVGLLGIAWLASWFYLFPDATWWRPPSVWFLVWGAVALIATRGMVAAILQPTPQKIGRGVGIAIQGLIVIDAVLATFYAGPVAGLAILALLPVTMILAQWIPQT